MIMWNAIRTSPGAQMPQREFAVQTTSRGKGYRIATSINPETTVIEAELARAGFTHYMPAEFMAVRNRHNKGVYELRRFALLKGWTFVSEVEDGQWLRLCGVPGVHSVVADASGRALPIGSIDIHRLRMYEQNSRAEARAKVAALTKSDENSARNSRKAIAKAARRKLFPGREAKLIWGDKVGRDATVAAWKDHGHVTVILHGLEAAGSVTVPFEFLKAAE